MTSGHHLAVCYCLHNVTDVVPREHCFTVTQCVCVGSQDFMVLMPEAYYAAAILQQKIYQPCTIPPTHNMYVLLLHSLSLGVCVCACLSVSVRLCVSVSVSVCLSVCLSVSVSMSVSICLCLYLCLSVCLSVAQHPFNLHMHVLSVY